MLHGALCMLLAICPLYFMLSAFVSVHMCNACAMHAMCVTSLGRRMRWRTLPRVRAQAFFPPPHPSLHPYAWHAWEWCTGVRIKVYIQACVIVCGGMAPTDPFGACAGYPVKDGKAHAH